MNEYKEKKETPPVIVGEFMNIVPNGQSRDPFYRHKGFVIFIKEVPDGQKSNYMNIKITALTKNCGFAIFIKALED